MVKSFPTALYACIAEGRAPQSDELASVTDKVLREVFLDDPPNRDHAATIARAALYGMPQSTGPDRGPRRTGARV